MLYHIKHSKVEVHPAVEGLLEPQAGEVGYITPQLLSQLHHLAIREPLNHEPEPLNIGEPLIPLHEQIEVATAVSVRRPQVNSKAFRAWLGFPEVQAFNPPRSYLLRRAVVYASPATAQYVNLIMDTSRRFVRATEGAHSRPTVTVDPNLPRFAIYVHAGAGYHSVSNEHYHLEAIDRALRGAHAMLREGCSAEDAVEIAIRAMENAEICNAGFGSNATADGIVEMDASIVDHTGASGAVGAVAGVRNPISAARSILRDITTIGYSQICPANLLVGPGAKRFAQLHHLQVVPDGAMLSPMAHMRHEAWAHDQQMKMREQGVLGDVPQPTMVIVADPDTGIESFVPAVNGSFGVETPFVPNEIASIFDHVAGEATRPTTNQVSGIVGPVDEVFSLTGSTEYSGSDMDESVENQAAGTVDFTGSQESGIAETTDSQASGILESVEIDAPGFLNFGANQATGSAENDAFEFMPFNYTYATGIAEPIGRPPRLAPATSQSDIPTEDDMIALMPSGVTNTLLRKRRAPSPSPESTEGRRPNPMASTRESTFDAIYATDDAETSSALASIRQAKVKAGFEANAKGKVKVKTEVTEEAEENDLFGTISEDEARACRPTRAFKTEEDDSPAMETKNHDDMITDTVGAIAVDMFGRIAAGSSSGGIGLKHPGRIGPAALLGAGTYVRVPATTDRNELTVAAVTSGTGEHINTTLTAQKATELLYHAGGPGQTTEDQALRVLVLDEFGNHPAVVRGNGSAQLGLLAVKKSNCGGVSMYYIHNTASFAVGSFRSVDAEPVLVCSRKAGKAEVENTTAQGGNHMHPRA